MILYYFTGEYLQLFPTINYYVAAELLYICPLKSLARLPPIPIFFRELRTWIKKRDDESIPTTLGRCKRMLENFYLLLNVNFFDNAPSACVSYK